MTRTDGGLSIDLNADLGEALTPEGIALEEAVMRSVTSVNIACGGHVGDATSMRRAVRTAAEHGVAVGAHPSYPDRAGFGRRPMGIDASALREVVREQVCALGVIARSEGVVMTHCKPHGALYHAASTDESIATAIWEACVEGGFEVRLVGLAGSRAVGWWRELGAAVIEEAFADRAYERDGTLRPRSTRGAVLDDPDAAAAQAVRIAAVGVAPCGDGGEVSVRAGTLCVHSDTPDAAVIAERVSAALRRAGVRLRSFG